MGKVRILPNGDIVGENDPRYHKSMPTNRSRPRQQQQQLGGVHQQQNNQQLQQGSIFEVANQKLVELGVPSFTLGSYDVKPIWLAGALLALFLMGVRGLLVVGFFFFIANSDLGGNDAAPNGGAGPSN